MRRALLSWTLVFALLAAGFGASVLALGSDLYSASGFVRSYLEALQRGDAEAALETPGVTGASALVTDETVGGFDGIHIISDVEAGGQHTVRAGYTMNGSEQVSQFTVERTGTRLGLFAIWRFTVSPVATLSVRVDHDTRFTANGVDAAVGEYAMLVPTAVTLDHDTEWLEALEVRPQVTEVGSTFDALVEVTPKDGFNEAATAAIAGFLDTCATQQVLKPTGCPFGTDVANRLDTPPVWTVITYPSAALRPAETVGSWQTQGAATVHVNAQVKSLFDGSLSTIDLDVPFESTYLITVGLDDSLSVHV